MPSTRAGGRNVHFYLFSEPDKPLGGMILNPSVSKKNFLSMLDILIVATGPYRVTLRSTREDLVPTDDALQPGQYDLRPYSRTDTISINDEHCIIRTLSRTKTGRNDFFRDRVRDRDKKCVITGTCNRRPDIDGWTGFETAHICPVSHEEYFVRNGFSRWITNRTGPGDTGINSVQNGLLMLAHIHELFDSFDISINPDDGFKITCFMGDSFGVDGRILDRVCQEDSGEEGARDELLRWHFRQAVLTNMRRDGEPSFEMDFPPGSDMMGEILSGPKPAERMEAELFLRLHGIGVPYEARPDEPS
ncbi:HNH endonuclease-domain-containing protein [Lipomyces kononenkoae]|uniref:HNH endonuclease-domain-containing protein n=1 Tax=Lipomyces kononenkoae TaxID=34357 RepID=A0ACC3ST95_LIPKO